MVEELLAKLDKVKLVNTNKWQACCPVHDDNSPSMTITVKNGTVLCHCFACGANGKDVVEAVGLKTSVLFPESLTDADRQRYAKQKLETKRSYAEMFVAIFEKKQKQGDYLTLNDKRGYKKHKAILAALVN